LSSTRARKPRDIQDRVSEALTEVDKSFIDGLKKFSGDSIREAGDAGVSINNSPSAPAGNYLPVLGGSMFGPIALAPPLDFRVDIDVNNTINISQFNENNQHSSNIQLEDTPTSSILDIIAGAAFDGQILIIRTFAPGAITISQATFDNGGNIQTLSDADVIMGNLQTKAFIFDASLIIFSNTGGTWREWTGGATGGGGLSEPVIFGINTLSPQTLPTTTTISWNTKNPQHIILDRAVEFDFTNLPANGSYEGILVIIDIDTIGGFTSPIWPASVVNPPIIPTTALSRFSVMLYTIDNGATVTHATSVGSSSSGSAFSGNLSDLVIDSTKNWLAQGVTNFGSLSGITGITGTGAGVVILGIDTYDFFQAGQSIQNKANPDGGLLYNVADLQSHIFRANTDEIARFEETAANVFRLNMLDHSVRDVRDVTLSNASGTVIFGGSSPAIGFDSAAARLLINYPTGASIFVTENNTIGSTQIKTNSLETNIVNALDLLQLGVDVTVPTIPGEFRNNGTDVTTFSGGVVRNFSDIPTGIPATTELDNLTTTNINAALLPNASAILDLGSELLPWRIAHFREIEFPVDASVPSGITDTQISKNASGNLAFNNAAVGGGFLFYFEGVNKWSLTPTQLSGDFILLENSLVFNDSTTNPTGDGEITRNGNSMILQSPTFQVQRATTGTFSGDFNLTKVDAAPSGGEPIYKINFNLFDSPTSVTYAQIIGEIEDVTDAGILKLNVRADGVSNVNAILIEGSPGTTSRTFVSLNSESRIGSDLAFQVPSGSIDLKIFPALNRLGIVVQDNIAFTVGTAGTIAIPVGSPNPVLPTKAELDTLYGSHKGAIGLDEGLIPHLFARSNNGDWQRINVDTTITV